MSDPFKIHGPALISFSGGRTSGYMLWRILQAHGGTLPDDVKVTFANTGKEMPQTLQFVVDCADRWDCDIEWLEYQAADDPQARWTQVNRYTAARAGEPFLALIRAKNYLPNPVTRFCTIELKIRPMKLYAQSLGWDHWSVVIGLRADEQGRVAKSRARSGAERFDNVMPLATAGIAKADVIEFWSRQNFGLQLANINGVTPHGNCDLCFLKSAATISGIMREMPERATWWIEAEAEALASKPSGARFRQDRPSYAEMARAVREQRNFDFGDRDELVDCSAGMDHDPPHSRTNLTGEHPSPRAIRLQPSRDRERRRVRGRATGSPRRVAGDCLPVHRIRAGSRRVASGLERSAGSEESSMRTRRHKITTEIYHAASWTAPEGGPEVEITFDYSEPTRSVWTGPRAAPAEPERISFISAVYTHDNSPLEGNWEEWAVDWLADHEDEASSKAWSDRGRDEDRRDDLLNEIEERGHD